jgi:enoyl-CoA hydratase/carnithine racemase
MSDKVLYSVHLGIAQITLNRPEKRNALDSEMIAGLLSSDDQCLSCQPLQAPLD